LQEWYSPRGSVAMESSEAATESRTSRSEEDGHRVPECTHTHRNHGETIPAS